MDNSYSHLSNDRPKKNSSEDNSPWHAAEGEELVDRFMAIRDWPNWYRGLSQSQMDAADTLFPSIRDDTKQGTTHRVRHDLKRLGLEPMMSPRKINLAMRLSAGNDIAFLWFLMELYYRNMCKNHNHSLETGYTLNEQIIMTAISHLDLIPTLRELDKILPVQPPKPTQPKKKEKKVKPPVIENVLFPYFEKQNQPVLYGKRLTLKGRIFVPNLTQYDKYQDPNYIVANEANRWYANYQFNEAKRVAKHIIDLQLDGIVNKTTSEKKVNNEKKLLCAHHQTKEALKESMINQLTVFKKKICEKCFDVNGYLRDQSYRSVVSYLNRKIEEAKEELHRITKLFTRTVSSLCCGRPSENRDDRSNRSNRSEVSVSKPAYYDAYFNKFESPGITTDNNTYFKAPTSHAPFQFNYNNIFDLSARDPIKDATLKALNESDKDVNRTGNSDEVVRKSCKKMWKGETQQRHKEYKQKMKQEELAATEEKKTPSDRRLKYDLPYYDPYDKKLMETMLKEAIDEIKKDKKFVLATFVDAYKTPPLREFIKKRYGFVHTKNEGRESYRLSKKVFYVLDRSDVILKCPHRSDITSTPWVSYNLRDYVLNKSNELRDQYYHNFKMSLMDKIRKYWGASRPYQCFGGPPRNQFCAYLPSRETDFHLFRTWKLSEHMHAKDEYDRRQRQKRKNSLGF